MTTISREAPSPVSLVPARPGAGRRAWTTARRFVRRKPLGAFGAAVILILIVVAVFAEVLAPADPIAQNQREALLGPSAKHLAGTDQFGRDVMSRLIHGARISLYVGVGATLLTLVPATVLGILSAYVGGAFDYLFQRVVDAIQAVPGLILLIAIVVVLGSNLFNIIVALSFGGAIVDSRVMRGATMQVSKADYVSAARVLGATDVRIMFQHILPNIMPPIIVLASLGFGQFILAEASLSFLGFGIQPPAPSWGNMLASEGRRYMYAAPWLLWAPAAALSLVVFGMNMFGDALRDVLDPRLRGVR
ncbi:MAG: ABC transporter permease [Candidatus Rokubacteria bacterium]|nr:ABC transporter permease [Chloroflexota bacterium]MBM4443276.1 ABC transporter permease [Candidatus Rokubacteria bacterium]